MSESNTQTDSTAANQTVAIAPTGIAANPYYFLHEGKYVSEVLDELQVLANATGRITNVVVRGSYEIAEMLDEHTSDGLTVDGYSMDFRMFLDDDDGDDGSVTSVIRDGPPMAEIVADIHDLSDSEQAEFNLSDRDDRALVGKAVLDELEAENEDENVSENQKTRGEKRIGRAKAKAKARAAEGLVEDAHDFAPATVDHAIILGDGTDDYKDAADDLRGHHQWSANQSECDGRVHTVELSAGERGALHWTHALLVRGQITEDELSDGQLSRLRENLEEGVFNSLDLDAPYQPDADGEDAAGVEPESSDRPTAEAQAIAGNSAD